MQVWPGTTTRMGWDVAGQAGTHARDAFGAAARTLRLAPSARPRSPAAGHCTTLYDKLCRVVMRRPCRVVQTRPSRPVCVPNGLPHPDAPHAQNAAGSSAVWKVGTCALPDQEEVLHAGLCSTLYLQYSSRLSSALTCSRLVRRSTRLTVPGNHTPKRTAPLVIAPPAPAPSSGHGWFHQHTWRGGRGYQSGAELHVT